MRYYKVKVISVSRIDNAAKYEDSLLIDWLPNKVFIYYVAPSEEKHCRAWIHQHLDFWSRSHWESIPDLIDSADVEYHASSETWPIDEEEAKRLIRLGAERVDIGVCE